MAGPSAIEGQPGETNGRIDAFLDKGDYKIITHSHNEGEGEVDLRVIASEELNTTPTQLIDYKLIESELGDFQQRSWWIALKQRKTVILEAAGRNLADLRIWKDGNWLIGDKPVSEVIEPKPGKPLMAQRMIVNLNPGLYLLSAYGGPSQPWAETSTAKPFYLRMGIPEIASSARMSRVMSPFGIDRWRVPAKSDYYRMALETPEAASFAVGRFNERDVFDSDASQAFIDKKTLVPVVQIKTRSQDQGFQLVTVQAEAGRHYILQHFMMNKYRRVDPGKYWVSTLHSGHGSDSVDATAMMTKWVGSEERYLYDSALNLDLNTGWKRRFNLLDSLTLFFEVKQTGTYFVNAEGVSAEYRFEPFLINNHRNYRAPDFKSMGKSTELDKGFYKLTVKPRGNGRRDGKGIVTLTVSPKNANARLESIAQTTARFNEVNVGSNEHLRVYINDQPGITSGIYVRSLPIDLSESLPVTQKAGELLNIPVTVPDEGELSVRSENGSLLDFKLTRKNTYVFDALNFKNKRANVKAGEYIVELDNKADRPINYQLIFTKKRDLKSTPLPVLSAARLSGIPQLPVLNARQTQFFDLNRNQQKSFNVQVESPSLYRLETRGLLQTAGTIRTRVTTRLDRQSNNGVGRNFLIQQFLRQGDYQLSVNTQGQTKGHLGLMLSKTELIEGGRLIESIPARFTLQPGAGLVYGFNIKEQGLYNIQSYGLNGNALVRLEDAQGWPLLKPGIDGNINYRFEPGSYRLVVLPMALESRVISVFSKADQQPITRQGHGPFELVLNQRTSHQWIEPQESEFQKNESPKTDDWFFDLPADSEVSISLSKSMQGSLYRQAENSRITLVVDFSDKKSFRSELLKGRYLLKVSNKKKNSFFDYAVSTSTVEILPGETRSVYAPETVPISIGKTGLVEISSFGYQDVKAALYDSSGALIAANDDRAHDWNFDLLENLDRGKYTLKVQAVGASSGETAVSVFVPQTTPEPQISLPATVQFSDAQIHIYPFKVNAPGILTVAAESTGAAGVSLERKTAKGWMNVGNENGENPVFGVVVEGATKSQTVHYRLKAWSPERRQMPIKLQIKLVKTRTLSERQFTSGVSLDKTALLMHKVSAIKVKLERPGVFKLKRASSKLFWARQNQQQLQRARYEFSSGESSEIWLLSVDESREIAASRLNLQKGQQSLMVSYAPQMTEQMWLDAQSEANVLDLFVASSRVGIPGIYLKTANKKTAEKAANEPYLLAMGVGHQSAVVATSGASSNRAHLRLKLWNNHRQISQLPVTVTQFSFENRVKRSLQSGINDILIKAMQAVKSALPVGQKKINFTLPAGVAAAFLSEGMVEQIVWSDTQDTAHEVITQAGMLVFYNTQKKIAYPLSVGVQTLTDNQHVANTVTDKILLRRYFSAAGYFHFKVKLTQAEKASGVSLHGYGQKLNLVGVDKKGNISSGSQLTLYDDAQVSMRHKEGLHVLWLSRPYRAPSAENILLTGSENDHFSQAISRALNSPAEVLSFRLQTPGLFNLSTSGAVILRIGVPGIDESLSVYESAMRGSVFLPAGESYLEFESTHGQALNDTLYLQKAKLSPLNEGLGEEVSLYPGQARLYVFSLENSTSEKHEIGIGVKASIDIAECTLYSDSGEVLGRGVTQKHILENGRYYLAINLPVDTASMVRVQPALVGFDRPSDDPPEAVMLEYQKLISQKTQ